MNMTWVKRTLRGTTVFARGKEDGTLDVGPDGRVDIKYKADEGAKIYRAGERNLGPAAADEAPVAPAPARPAPARRASGAEPPIIVYTDGACTGNPGPMGVGAVILRGTERKEIGEYIGMGTNNIAELTAIERALDNIADDERGRAILVHVDSAYAIGVVSGAYKAKKNVELVARIRRKASAFPGLRFVKVAGHAGVTENERCDQLATAAVAAARRAPRRGSA
jgi:ribonuclease HI